MTLNEAVWRYWDEVGKAKRSSKDIATNLEMVTTFMDPNMHLTDVDTNVIAEAMAERARTPIMRKQSVNGEVVMAPTEIMPQSATA